MKPFLFLFRLSVKCILPGVCIILMLQVSSCMKSGPQSGVSYTGTSTLTHAAPNAAAGAGGKILFAGGYDVNADTFSRTVDIYDASTGAWSTTQLSQARSGIAGAGAGNKILFAGGAIQNVVSDIVDIYDVSSNSWTTARLSVARDRPVAAAAGSKVLFAGGQGAGYSIINTVDIYDVVTNTWTTAQLSEARYLFAAGAAGNKILFGGGTGANNTTTTVDIYDVVSNDWTTAQLSEARFSLAGGGTGDKVLFAGGLANPGICSDVVDIYTVSTNTWTTGRLSTPRENITAASTGDKIFFGGGNIVTRPPGGNGNLYDSTVYNTVDIYNASSNGWYTDKLSEPKKNTVAAGSGNKILFAGGAVVDSSTYAYGLFTNYYSLSKTVDIFTVQ